MNIALFKQKTDGYFCNRLLLPVLHLILLEVMTVKLLVFNIVLVILLHIPNSSSDNLVKVPSMKLVIERNY
jgi:hypothetical protein